jgi:hypothetical protein
MGEACSARVDIKMHTNYTLESLREEPTLKNIYERIILKWILGK